MQIRRVISAALSAAAVATALIGATPTNATASEQCAQEIYVYFWFGATGLRATHGNETAPNSAAAPPVNFPTHAMGCILLQPEVDAEPAFVITPGATLVSSRFTRSGLTPADGPRIDYRFANAAGATYFANGEARGKAVVECNLDQAACDAGQGVTDASSPLVPMNPVSVGNMRAEYYVDNAGQAGITLHSIANS